MYNTSEIVKEFEKDMAIIDNALTRSYEDYVRYDLASTQNILTRISGDISAINFVAKFEIKDVIFNPPATIVLWKDGTKTVVKEQDGCEFNPWVGMAMACSKKMLGNKGNYFEVFKKYCEPYEEKMGQTISIHYKGFKSKEDAKKALRDYMTVIRASLGEVEDVEEDEPLYNPVEETYMQINNFLNGKGSLDLDEIRGLLGEALE